MIPMFAIFLVLALVGVLLFAKWHNSKSIDTLTQNLTHEKDFTKPETDKLIDSAKKADEALDQRVDESKEKVKEIEKDVEKIKKHQIDTIPHLQEDIEIPEGGKDAIEENDVK